jgi:hypothetical protein
MKKVRNLADMYMFHNGVPYCDWCTAYNAKLGELRTATDVLYCFRPVAAVGFTTQPHAVDWGQRRLIWRVWVRGEPVFACKKIPSAIVRRVETEEELPKVYKRRKIIKDD